MANQFLDEDGLKKLIQNIKSVTDTKLKISDSIVISVESVTGQVGKKLKFSKHG